MVQIIKNFVFVYGVFNFLAEKQFYLVECGLTYVIRQTTNLRNWQVYVFPPRFVVDEMKITVVQWTFSLCEKTFSHWPSRTLVGLIEALVDLYHQTTILCCYQSHTQCKEHSGGTMLCSTNDDDTVFEFTHGICHETMRENDMFHRLPKQSAL